MDLKIGNGQLMLGDCLELMRQIPDDSIDMVLCDPPYGMNWNSNWRKGESKHRKIENDDNLEWLADFTKQCFRVLKNNRGGYFFCSFHNIDIFKQELEKLFKIKNLIVWVKNNHGTGDLKGSYAPKHEMIWFVVKGRPLLRGKRYSDVVEFSRTSNEMHPTQKPVDLIEFMLKNFSDTNDIVLDPFSGSGTTAIAAENTERRWVCIEKDDEYYFKSAQRVCEHVKRS